MCVSNRDVYWEIHFLLDFFFCEDERVGCNAERWRRDEYVQKSRQGSPVGCFAAGHVTYGHISWQRLFPPQGFHKWMANFGRMHFTQDPAHSEPSCGLQRLQQAPQNRNGNSPSGLKVFLLNYIEFFEDFISPGTELEGVNLDIHSIHLKDWLH